MSYLYQRFIALIIGDLLSMLALQLTVAPGEPSLTHHGSFRQIQRYIFIHLTIVPLLFFFLQNS